jgi:heme/copper-type cytochrome/quinol oxidase subunit 3
MSEGSDSTHLLMASLFSTEALMEYRNNIVSNFDSVASCFGEQSSYYCFGVHGLHLIKKLTPLWASLVRKRLWALKSKRVVLLSMMKVHL